MENKHYLIGVGIAALLVGFFVSKNMYENDYSKLSKSEIITQLSNMDAIYKKINGQYVVPSLAAYNAMSRRELIILLSSNLSASFNLK